MQSCNRYRSVLLCAVITLVSAVPWSFSVAAEGPVVPEPVIKTKPVESDPSIETSPVKSEPVGTSSPVESEPVIKASEVVVSATKTPVPVTQLTSAVEVITGEELERRQVKTVVDALRLSQGLTVFSTGGPGTTSSVRIRGSNSDQVLVLIDGAIMNSPTLGNFNFANLTTDNIERIEILRGAQSMLWGADAMGGVINITTKKGSSTLSGNAFFEYGSFLSIREGGQVSGKKGIVDFSAAISRWDHTGFSAVNYRRGASERDGFHNWQTSARLGIALPHEGRLDFNFRLLQGRTDIDGGFGPGFDTLGAFTNSQQFVYGASYTQPITEWWNQALTVSRQTEDLETFSGTTQRNVQTGVVSPPFFFSFRSQIDTVANRVEWQHNFQIVKPLLLSVGYQFRDAQGENRDLLTNNLDIPRKVISSHAGFAQAQLNLWDRVFATAGVRQDEYNAFGSATTYRVTGGYLHQETGTKFRSSYATGFRAPTINQLYFPNFGNPNLKPEKSQSMDVGVDQYFFDNRLTLSAGYFWNRFRDMIVAQESLDVCGLSPFGPFPASCAQNIGEVSTKGWEASVKYAVLRDMRWIKSLDVQAQYTNTLTRNQDEFPGNRAPRIPVDQWSMIITYQPITPVRINLEGRYVGSRFNDAANQQSMRAFDVWNVSASYDVTNRVQTYVRVDNIFDEKYEEILLFGTPVRSIFAGLKLNYDVP